jgi:uncharacterized membrane protein
MSAKSDPRDEPTGAEYSYRRTLSAGELLPAIGVGVAAGVVAFYVARLFLQRTPLSAGALSTSRRQSRLPRSHGG